MSNYVKLGDGPLAKAISERLIEVRVPPTHEATEAIRRFLDHPGATLVVDHSVVPPVVRVERGSFGL